MLESASIILTIVVFSAAAFYDLKTREVPDALWKMLLPTILSLTVIRVVFLSLSLKLVLVSIIVTTILAFLAFYTGVFGGADAKAFICLSVAIPLHARPFLNIFGYVHPFVPLMVFYNAYLLSATVVLRNVAFNVVWRLRGKNLFQGLESESSIRKILALLTGYRTFFRTLQSSVHLYPMEVCDEETGRKHLKFFSSAFSDREEILSQMKPCFSKDLKTELWVSPSIPLLFYVLFALVISVFFGDLFIWVVFRLLSFLWTLA